MTDLELYKSLFLYDPLTGKLYWKERGLDDFPDERTYHSWNTRHAGREAGSTDASERPRITMKRKSIFVHHIVWLLHFGEWPKDNIHHLNGDITDNRIENLSCGPDKLLQKNNKSGVSGVCFHRRSGKYAASIRGNRNKTHIGLYDTLEEARAAREEALKKFRGKL